MYDYNAIRIRQAVQTFAIAFITTSTSLLLTVIFLGLPQYYYHLSSRNVEEIAVANQQGSQYVTSRTYIAGWKAVRNLCVVASGFLTAILFKIPNDNSPEYIKWFLIYPSLVLITLALITSTMFIAHFEGEAFNHHLETTGRPSFARSIVFALPAIMLVWGLYLTLGWVAYTILSISSQFRPGMMHYLSIIVLLGSIIIAFGTLLVVFYALHRFS